MEEYFEVINETGEKVLLEKLHTFSFNGTNYIIYTDYSTNEDDEIAVLAAKYIIKDKEMQLLPIDNDNEWDLVDKEWENVNHA